MAIAGALVLAGLATLAWRSRTRRPGIAAAVVAWVLAYLPTSGLVQVGVQVAADRYVYLAALAWTPLVAAAAMPGRGRLRFAVGVVVLLLLVPLTVRQVGVWHDSVTLWEHTLALAPDSPIARQQLGRAYVEVDRVDDALALYERQLREHPDSARSWSDYGALLTAAGLPERALPILEKALAIDPSDAGTWYARALIRDRQGDAAGALADYTESLRRDPAQGFAYNNRALVRAKLGDVPGALDDFARALTFEPVLNADTAFSVWANYGMLLARTGQVDPGIRALRTAVALAPAEARGRLDDILHHLEARRDGG
jgi:tetratricopeptide (TPR) repeat protein